MVNKRFVKEMTRDELELVLLANESLQDANFQLMVRSETALISEHLETLSDTLANWEVDGDKWIVLTMNEACAERFVEALNELQGSYSVLAGKDAQLLEEVVQKLNLLNRTDAWSDDYDILEREVNEKAKRLAYLLSAQYTRNYRLLHGRHQQLEHFLQSYVPEHLNPEAFVLEGEEKALLYEPVAPHT